MPDISMCSTLECAVSARCHRHPDSGTKAGDLQVWGAFEPEKGAECEGFWPASGVERGDIDSRMAHLVTSDQPPDEAMAAAPVLDAWRIVGIPDKEGTLHFVARGDVSGSPKFADGHEITTSGIATVDVARRWVCTRNSLYRLGARHRQFEPVVHVAIQENWVEAWKVAIEGTGQHTVPAWLWAAASEIVLDPVDWTRRRAVASMVGDHLHRSGRALVARAWWLLSTNASDKDAAREIYDSLCSSVTDIQTPLVSDTIDGWGLLAKGLPFGADLSDCVAAARQIGGTHVKPSKDWPLILKMALAVDTAQAAQVFLSAARIPAALAEAFDMAHLLDRKTRRTTARDMLSQYLDDDGSLLDDLSQCLKLLALDPAEKSACAAVCIDIESAIGEAGRDPESERVVRAWHLLSCDKRAPFAPEDPVLSAWHLDTPGNIGSTASDVLRELRIDVDSATPSREPGVVVLPKVGGIGETSSGKEAQREFKDLVGRHVPLACANDIAGVRAKLREEFPHLHDAVDVLLSDLTEGEPIRLRPTLLVGAAGGGKSRVARRLAEVLPISLHRHDGAGSGDNTFGGTPRRWSSGEHCVALEAIRRNMIANPVVLVDEIDKAAQRGNNGSLANALMPFLEQETSRAYPDPFVQSDVDLSHVSYLLTANDDTVLPGPLRDRLRVVRIPEPTIEHLVQIARTVVSDIAKERGGDGRWFADLGDGELAIAESLWPGGSVRRLRAIVERILARRESNPRN